MDDEEKEVTVNDKAKAYEVASFLNNRKSWQGMQVLQELKEGIPSL
jgi:hypothetical protein